MRKYTTTLLTCAFFALCAIYAPLTRQAVAEGLQLVLTTALPALFPFFFGASLLVSTGGIDLLGRLFAPLFRHVYRLPACAAGAFVLSVTGGYPVGVQTAVQLYRNGQLTRAQTCHLLAFVNNTGPAFCVGLCGAVLGNPAWGGRLYAVHVATALLVGLLFCDRTAPLPTKKGQDFSCPSLLSCFLSSVQQAGITSLRIGGFILVFALLRCILQALGVLVLLGHWIAPLLTLGGVATAEQALLGGLLELTYGLQQLPATVGAPLLPLASLLVAFGGLSVWAQSAALLENTDLPLHRLCLGKCLHAVLACGVMWVVR